MSNVVEFIRPSPPADESEEAPEPAARELLVSIGRLSRQAGGLGLTEVEYILGMAMDSLEESIRRRG